jgi:hypothetical protein
MHMRALLLLCVAAGCARGPAFKLDVTEPHEVGEDLTVAVRVKQPDEDQNGEIVVTRPDGTTVKRRVAFDTALARVKLGPPSPRPGIDPTLTAPGDYKIELRKGERVLATYALTVKTARLDELLPAEPIAEYKPVARFTRAKQSGTGRWKTYGAIYEHAYRKDVQVEVLIEEPRGALAQAWRLYADEGTRAVILGNTVRFLERTSSVTASWTSGKRIVSMKAPTLDDLERGLIGHFLERFPSNL